MVRGLSSFRNWFKGFEKYYVFIGGTACDLLMKQAGKEFRSTHDLDMVLLIEFVDAVFVSHFWRFIKIAGYKHCHKSTGLSEFYRFYSPDSSAYPAMIELFSRPKEIVNLSNRSVLMPLAISEDVSDLSAIILNDEYYEFLKTGIKIVDEIPVLAITHLLPFKAKALLDLLDRKQIWTCHRNEGLPGLCR